MSKEVTRSEGKKPMAVRHAAAVAVVSIVAIVIAFWVLSSLVGIVVFFIKLAVVVALIAAVFWLISRFRR